MFHSFILFLLLVIPAILAGQDDVIVTMNDSRISFQVGNGQFVDPFNHNATSPIYDDCGGVAALFVDAETASLVFTGTAVNVTLIGDESGVTADIYLDGALMAQQNTSSTQSINNTCDPILVQSPSGLSFGSHILTIVKENGPPNVTSVVYIQSISYLVPPPVTATRSVPSYPSSSEISIQTSTPPSKTSSMPKTRTTSIGAIVGVTVGVIALLGSVCTGL